MALYLFNTFAQNANNQEFFNEIDKCFYDFLSRALIERPTIQTQTVNLLVYLSNFGPVPKIRIASHKFLLKQLINLLVTEIRSNRMEMDEDDEKKEKEKREKENPMNWSIDKKIALVLANIASEPKNRMAFVLYEPIFAEIIERKSDVSEIIASMILLAS